MELPFKVYRNNQFYANLSWLLYKYFHIKRTLPCGRTSKDSYLCCELDPAKENSIVINNGETHEIRCKVCGSTHMMSNQYINPDNFEEDMYSW